MVRDREIKYEYIDKYLELKPIMNNYIHNDIYTGEEVETTAFCLLTYIDGFKEIQNKIKNEIKENYFETNKEPLKYKRYAEYYIQELEKSIVDIPSINEEQVKKWLLEFFKIHYIDFNSIFYLLKNEDSLFFLGDDWLQPGYSPSIYPEVQNDLYHFIKGETVKIIRQWLSSHLDNEIDKKTNDYKKIYLASVAFYYIYSDVTINQNNKDKKVKEILGNKVINGTKFLEKYNMFREKNNRVFYISKRESTWRNKYFDQAIKLLKEDGNESALTKCKKEQKEFKEKVKGEIS